MPAGSLRHRITITQETGDPDTPGSTGRFESSPSVVTTTEPAEVMQPGGAELVRMGVQIGNTTSHVFKIRWRRSLLDTLGSQPANNTTITHDGRTIDLVAVHDITGRKRWLILEGKQTT